jgi:hypothetical protein
MMLFLTMSVDIVGIQFFELNDAYEVLEADAEKECDKDKNESDKKLITDSESSDDLWTNPYSEHEFSDTKLDLNPVYLRVFDPPPESV